MPRADMVPAAYARNAVTLPYSKCLMIAEYTILANSIYAVIFRLFVLPTGRYHFSHIYYYISIFDIIIYESTIILYYYLSTLAYHRCL